MGVFSVEDLDEDMSMQKMEALYVHVSWCIWHEGVNLFDDSYPGDLIDVNSLRNQCVAKQHHNGYASHLIARATNNELRAVMEKIPQQVESERQLSVHFNWVANHEGQRLVFLSSLETGDFKGIRSIYHNYQSHNPNARSLLSCVNNFYIKALIDEI